MSPHFRGANHKCIFGIFHMCHMPCPSHPSAISIPTIKGEAHTSCSFSLHNSLQTPIFPPSRSEYYPLYHSETPSIYTLPLLKYHILLPYKTLGKAQFLCSLYFLNTNTTYTKICKQQLHTALHLAINKATKLTQYLLV